MKIEKVIGQIFTYPTKRSVDSDGHSHPGETTQAKMAMLTVQSDTGDCGYAFAPPEVVRAHVLDAFVRLSLIHI